MQANNYKLSYQNRLHLNKEAGDLIHVFGQGYYIVDEHGREVSAFGDEDRFEILIKKFKFRTQLIDQLNAVFEHRYDFKEDNQLWIDNQPVRDSYLNLPSNEQEVAEYFNLISNEGWLSLCLSKKYWFFLSLIT